MKNMGFTRTMFPAAKADALDGLKEFTMGRAGDYTNERLLCPIPTKKKVAFDRWRIH